MIVSAVKTICGLLLSVTRAAIEITVTDVARRDGVVADGQRRVLRLAMPLPSRVPLAIVLYCPPSRFTIPLGTPIPDGFTLIVKVTECPKSDGFIEEVTVVVVSAVKTTCGLPAQRTRAGSEVTVT